MNNWALLLFFLVALAAALFWDLQQWRSRDTETLLAYNRGIIHCRRGDYSAALEAFRGASAALDWASRPLALYNLGTTHLLFASTQGSPTSPETADHVLAAIRYLEEAVALSPADSDAVHNLALARVQLKALNPAEPSRAVKEPQPVISRLEHRESQPDRQLSKQLPAGAAKPGLATVMDGAAEMRQAEKLPREQALRMLDEARGREVLPSTQVATGKPGNLIPPEKDW